MEYETWKPSEKEKKNNDESYWRLQSCRKAVDGLINAMDPKKRTEVKRKIFRPHSDSRLLSEIVTHPYVGMISSDVNYYASEAKSYKIKIQPRIGAYKDFSWDRTNGMYFWHSTKSSMLFSQRMKELVPHTEKSGPLFTVDYKVLFMGPKRYASKIKEKTGPEGCFPKNHIIATGHQNHSVEIPSTFFAQRKDDNKSLTLFGQKKALMLSGVKIPTLDDSTVYRDVIAITVGAKKFPHQTIKGIRYHTDLYAYEKNNMVGLGSSPLLAKNTWHKLMFDHTVDVLMDL
jgi:hypothetical protein